MLFTLITQLTVSRPCSGMAVLRCQLQIIVIIIIIIIALLILAK